MTLTLLSAAASFSPTSPASRAGQGVHAGVNLWCLEPGQDIHPHVHEATTPGRHRGGGWFLTATPSIPCRPAPSSSRPRAKPTACAQSPASPSFPSAPAEPGGRPRSPPPSATPRCAARSCLFLSSSRDVFLLPPSLVWSTFCLCTMPIIRQPRRCRGGRRRSFEDVSTVRARFR